MKNKKKTFMKKKRKSKPKTDKNVLDEIIRVDHAGEYGATKIYDVLYEWIFCFNF